MFSQNVASDTSVEKQKDQNVQDDYIWTLKAFCDSWHQFIQAAEQKALTILRIPLNKLLQHELDQCYCFG